MKRSRTQADKGAWTIAGGPFSRVNLLESAADDPHVVADAMNQLGTIVGRAAATLEE